MSYTAEISRRNPTAFLFIIDLSASMGTPWQGPTTRAQCVSDALNRVLHELILKCSKEDGIRHYFDIGVISYSGLGVKDGLPGSSLSLFRPIFRLEEEPLRLETRRMKVPDGAGGLVETETKFPVWFDAKHAGNTPMVAAFERAAKEVAEWCDAHPAAYPPTILHLTDGDSTDGDPEPFAKMIQRMRTEDGNVLLMNIHISNGGTSIKYPSTEPAHPPAAGLLYRMSSELPPVMQGTAQALGYDVRDSARGYIYGADVVDMVQFFDIGTRAANKAP